VSMELHKSSFCVHLESVSDLNQREIVNSFEVIDYRTPVDKKEFSRAMNEPYLMAFDC